MRLLPDFSFRSAVTTVFVPSDHFFLRIVPLVPGVPVPEQAALALEGLAPFPAAQLAWGCCAAPDLTAALVYAAHRRRFAPEHTAAWERAELTVPDVLPLLGTAPTGAGLRVLVTGTRLCGAAWDGRSAWPGAVLARDCVAPVTQEERRQFATELAARAGLPETPVEFLEGEPAVRREGPRLIFEVRDAAGAVVAATVLPLAAQDQFDIRDHAFLADRRGERRQADRRWRTVQVVLGGLAAALLLDLGALALGLAGRAQHARIAAQAPYVARLEMAHGLTNRVDTLAHRRLRFFEMLAAINEPRPRSIQFTRTGSSGRTGLEIEAQTTSADDVGLYETALRNLPTLDTVEVHDLRARDGITSFRLAVMFRVEQGGAQ